MRNLAEIVAVREELEHLSTSLYEAGRKHLMSKTPPLCQNGVWLLTTSSGAALHNIFAEPGNTFRPMTNSAFSPCRERLRDAAGMLGTGSVHLVNTTWQGLPSRKSRDLRDHRPYPSALLHETPLSSTFWRSLGQLPCLFPLSCVRHLSEETRKGEHNPKRRLLGYVLGPGLCPPQAFPWMLQVHSDFY